MAPAREDLPEERPWHVSDALPTWSSSRDGMLQVECFGRVLKCAYAAAGAQRHSGHSETRRRGFGGLLGARHSRPRVPLSSADPGILAGSEIRTEDDVLHLKQVCLGGP